MSFPVYGRPRPHNAYPAPAEVDRLPFTLLRNALVTRDPELVAAAIEAYEEDADNRELYDPPEGPYPLPQKMQFQQWKTPPMTAFANRPDHADPYATTVALMQVRAELLDRERDLIEANNPQRYGISHAAFDRRASTAYEPVDTSELLFRDAPAEGRPIYPYPYARPTEEVLDEDEELGPYTQGIQRSLEEVRAVQGRFLSIIVDDVRLRGRR